MHLINTWVQFITSEEELGMSEIMLIISLEHDCNIKVTINPKGIVDTVVGVSI